MDIKLLEENSQLSTLNEMVIHSEDSLPTNIENSIYYAKIRTLLHGEIIGFCKEQIELKNDLQFFRMSVGQTMTETEIREYLDGLQEKYNNKNTNVGITYHIEATRIDYGVAVFVVIRRGDLYMKKFVFRFRKESTTDGVADLSNIGTIKR